MKVMKWKPFDLWLQPRRNSFWDTPSLLARDFDNLFSGLDFNPAVDVYEEDGKIRVKAEVPGLTEKDVSVEVKDNMLTITGEKKNENKEEKEGYFYSERSFGSFKRSFRLPQGTDAAKISANFKNGVLDVEIPQPEEVKPEKITIKS